MKFSESLKSNRDFKNVYGRKKSYANRYLVMYVLENGLDKNRLGISVSKKVGNSVVRHRVTRLIRESYRLHEDLFRSGLDIVVVARASAKRSRVRCCMCRSFIKMYWCSYEKDFYMDNLVLQKISFTFKIYEMPLFSVLLAVWARGSRAVWRAEGRITLYMENTPVQSFFKRRI